MLRKAFGAPIGGAFVERGKRPMPPPALTIPRLAPVPIPAPANTMHRQLLQAKSAANLPAAVLQGQRVMPCAATRVERIPFVPPPALSLTRTPRCVPQVPGNRTLQRAAPVTSPLNSPPAVAHAVPLYHATGTQNLESIASSGLDPSQGGTGGATDVAAALAADDAVEREAQRIRKLNSANKVHLGGYGTAHTYFSGFKYLSAIDALKAKKRAEIIASEGIPQGWRENEQLNQKINKNPDVVAAISKAHQERAMLRIHAHRELGREFDLDPDEPGQDPANGMFAVRTQHGVGPHMLSIHTAEGWIPLLEYHGRAVKPLLTGPVGHAESDEHRANALAFHKAADSTAWNAARKAEQDKIALNAPAASAAAIVAPKPSANEALALEMARREARRTAQRGAPSAVGHPFVPATSTPIAPAATAPGTPAAFNSASSTL